jgi:hypothetical protein
MEWPPTDAVQESVFQSHVAKVAGRFYKLDQVILNLAPTILLVLLSPLYLRHYYRQPIRALSGHVLWVKLVCLINSLQSLLRGFMNWTLVIVGLLTSCSEDCRCRAHGY